jgi:hypothetical protein
MNSLTHIHGVASVEVFDVPMETLDGKLTVTKDIHIKTRDGSEIVIFCYVGPVDDVKADA